MYRTNGITIIVQHLQISIILVTFVYLWVANSKMKIYNFAIVSEIGQCDDKSTVLRGENVVEKSHRTLANSSSNLGQGNKIYTIFQ